MSCTGLVYAGKGRCCSGRTGCSAGRYGRGVDCGGRTGEESDETELSLLVPPCKQLPVSLPLPAMRIIVVQPKFCYL